jgi:hypothetical protein
MNQSATNKNLGNLSPQSPCTLRKVNVHVRHYPGIFLLALQPLLEGSSRRSSQKRGANTETRILRVRFDQRVHMHVDRLLHDTCAA